MGAFAPRVRAANRAFRSNLFTGLAASKKYFHCNPLRGLKKGRRANRQRPRTRRRKIPTNM
jgi:hypothetical protein